MKRRRAVNGDRLRQILEARREYKAALADAQLAHDLALLRADVTYERALAAAAKCYKEAKRNGDHRE